ncbi:hypothetical protein [Bradyrhizobium sp. BWA-3-5]
MTRRTLLRITAAAGALPLLVSRIGFHADRS